MDVFVVYNDERIVKINSKRLKFDKIFSRNQTDRQKKEMEIKGLKYFIILLFGGIKILS